MAVDETSRSARYQIDGKKQAGRFSYERTNEQKGSPSVYGVQLGWRLNTTITSFTYT